jgi:hypothetical protein
LRILIRRNWPPAERVAHKAKHGADLFSATRAGSVARIRPMAFSLIGHAVVLMVAFLNQAPIPSEQRQTLYDEVIRPRQHDLVWYSFGRKLPPVSPTERQDRQSSGAEFSASLQTIVSSPRSGEPGAQMVRRPLPQVSSQPRIASPNILAFRIPLIPPPVIPPPAPKPFVPPPTPHTAQQAAALPEAPQISNAVRSGSLPLIAEDPVAPLAIKPVARRFVPPVADHTNPGIAQGLPPVVEAPTLDLVGFPSSTVDVAVIGLNPAAKLTAPLPDTSLDAKFSVGPVSSGEPGSPAPVPGLALSVPGLLVRDWPAPKIRAG